MWRVTCVGVIALVVIVAVKDGATKSERLVGVARCACTSIGVAGSQSNCGSDGR
jgi:hypothetical protein